jgi:hypothetical protein
MRWILLGAAAVGITTLASAGALAATPPPNLHIARSNPAITNADYYWHHNHYHHRHWAHGRYHYY